MFSWEGIFAFLTARGDFRGKKLVLGSNADYGQPYELSDQAASLFLTNYPSFFLVYFVGNTLQFDSLTLAF